MHAACAARMCPGHIEILFAHFPQDLAGAFSFP
jgi:hypothetical protein